MRFRPRGHAVRGAALVLALLAASRALSSTEGETPSAETFLAETGSGVVPVASETRLLVRGVEGQVSVQPGEAGREVRFQSTSAGVGGTPDVEVPVAVWTDGGAFRFGPPRGQEKVTTLLRVWIPPGMAVRLELAEADVSAGGTDGELTLRGRRLRFSAAGLLAPVDLDIDGGSVRIVDSMRSVSLAGRDLAVEVGSVRGKVRLRLTGGTANLNTLLSELDGDFTGAKVAIDTVSGSADLHFRGGTARIARLSAGGEIASAGCPIHLEEALGEISVESDSDVHFRDCRGALHIEDTGGNVNGERHDGLLEVKTDNARIGLQHVTGQMRIGGSGLRVALEDIGAELEVFAQSSNVVVQGAGSTVTIDNDRGDVTVKGVAGATDVRSQGGEVHVLQASASVTISADGPQVEVGWTSLPSDKNSRIANEGGEITVRFPGTAGCHVDARSKFGRIDSTLPKLRLEGGGGSVQGVVGDGSRKLVTLEASGDIHLLGAADPTPAGESPAQP